MGVATKSRYPVEVFPIKKFKHVMEFTSNHFLRIYCYSYLLQETRKPENDVVYMDEDDDAMPSSNLVKDDTNGLAEMEEDARTEKSVKVDEEEVKPDEVIHEVAVGKGLAGALKILKERGSLNEGTDWGGRTTDKKKSKLVGVEDGPKDIRIERMDEFGRVVNNSPTLGLPLIE